MTDAVPWPDWRVRSEATGGPREVLHYAGAARASITDTPDGWKLQLQDGAYTFCMTLEKAKAKAENIIASDADLPPVPGRP